MNARSLVMLIAGILLWVFNATLEAFASTHVPPKRQTEFNDHNYQPSRQINSIAPTASVTLRAKPERDRRVIQSNLEKVKWKSARGTATEYRVYYEYDNTNITFVSVCSNYRTGSLDYRNCRKAAKQWFGTRCNNSNASGRMYCHASNAFRP